LGGYHEEKGKKLKQGGKNNLVSRGREEKAGQEKRKKRT